MPCEGTVDIVGRPDADRHRFGELQPHLLARLLEPAEHLPDQPLLEQLRGRLSREGRLGRPLLAPKHPIRFRIVLRICLGRERHATNVELGGEDRVPLARPRLGVHGTAGEEDEFGERYPRLDLGPLAELASDLDQLADPLHASLEMFVAFAGLLGPRPEVDRGRGFRERRVRKLLVDPFGRERSERGQ